MQESPAEENIEPKDLIGKSNPLGSITVQQLASLVGGQGVEIIKKRTNILEMARSGSIRLTHPRDWLLFKSDSGIYGYLQDSGCERVLDIWGISISNVSEYAREELPDGTFMYSVTGDGYCSLTQQTVEKLLGARDSKSMDLEKDVHPGKLKIETMKAARSNLDGGMVRHMTGLANVPLEEINRVFGRKLDDLSGFSLGKGFGSKAIRVGVDTSDFGNPPSCPKCSKPMRLVDGKNGHFWGCQDYKTCGQKPITAKRKTPVSESKEYTTIEDDFLSESVNPREPGEETIGQIKNRLLDEIKDDPAKHEFKIKILKAQTVEELKELQRSLKF